MTHALPIAASAPLTGNRPAAAPGLPARLVLSAFVLFHITATIVWLMPNSALKQSLGHLTHTYISHMGLWQHWGMFAPEPSNLNPYLSAVVTYQDGSVHEWTWPRMADLNLAERYQKERYRKFSEYARMDNFAVIWPSMARWIAQENNTRPGNRPVRVQLQRHWWFVPPPAGGHIGADPPHEWSMYPFFETAISAGDLQ